MPRPTDDGGDRTDPWDAAMRTHFGDGEPADGRERRRFTVGIVPLAAAGAVVIALLVVAVVAGVVARQNLDRGDQWRDRASTLQQLVADRTDELNRQTARLNVASTRLRRIRTQLDRSESDVAQLEVRQRELAAEKASVEDQRGALEQERADLTDAADQLLECNRGLITIVQALAEGVTPEEATATDTADRCDLAQQSMDRYVARYGTG